MLEMVKIRRLKKQDIAFVVESVQREQWGHTERDVERYLEHEPNGCFIAEQAKQKVGHIFTINYGELGWIGLLIVNPEKRERGIGTALMEKAISYLREKETKTIGLDAVEKAVSLYERFGFKKTCDSLRYKRQQTEEAKWQHPPAKNIHPLRPNNLKPIAKFDAKFFGADRTRVLQSLYDDFPNQCWIAKRNRKILGYIMNRKDSDVCRVGPWVCRPKHLEIAKELFEACVDAMHEKTVEIHVGVLATNLDAVALIEDLGFTQVSKSIRMFMGKQTQVGDAMGVYGIAAAEIG
jgi:ribosomal protein S18 acetylase RimI-like enzyme